MDAVVISNCGEDRLDALEGLWAALHAHHASLPGLPATRPVQDSWRRRRAEYEKWLAEGDAQLLIADNDGEAIGYAMVRFAAGPPTWDLGDRVAELETLSVAEKARGEGVGKMLIEAVRDIARQGGAERLLVAVAHTNADALRLYDREGLRPFYVVLADEGEGLGKASPAS